MILLEKNIYILQSRQWEKLCVSVFTRYLKVLSIFYSEKPEYKHPKKEKEQKTKNKNQAIGVRTQAQRVSIKLFTAWHTANDNIWSSWSKSICTVNVKLSNPRSAPQALCLTYYATKVSSGFRHYAKG